MIGVAVSRQARKSFLLALVLAGVVAPGAAAHGPDPLLGGSLFGQDQQVKYRWRSGQVPPDWMKNAINDAADDSNASRASRAAILDYDATSHSLIAYDEPTGCGSLGAACTSRSGAPDTFTMSFRRQGYVFDWGAMRWCQAYANPADGCYDAEAIALHEFGHVEDLGHHVMNADESDFRDSIMEPVGRTKPRAGYNAARYARCDVAVLQVRYDIPTSTTPIAICQSLDTTLSLTASDTSVGYREAVTFTAVLRIATSPANGRLSANLLSQRSVTLQRRVPGSTTWSGMGSMGDAASGGGYVMTQTPLTTYEWRAVFPEPDDEGLQVATSAIVTVSVAPCTGGGCPTGTRN
jgi:hypothetical protein